MADIKISALTDGGEALATDDIPVNRAGANRRVRPPLPFGPYADVTALQAAKAAATYPGRHAYVGSAAPYTIYTSNGTAWAIGALGPYATAAALEAAFPAASNTGRFATVGASAPYAIYASNGTAWAPVLGLTTIVSTSRALTAADNGNTLECSAGVALTVPGGGALGSNFGVAVEVPAGTVSVMSSGGALLNGATTTLTRASTNVMFAIVARASATDSYSVTGS